MSNTFRSAGSIAWYGIRRWIKKPEIYMTVLCLFIFMQAKVQPLRMLIEEAQTAATPYLFPFLFSDGQMTFFIMMGCVILFSDAPFLDSGYAAALMRTGRKKWAGGQIFYILCTSFGYLLMVFLLSLISLWPDISWKNQWGSIWQTLAQTDAGYQIRLELDVPYRILVDYQPFQAVAMQFFIAWLVCVFLGLLLFAGNFHLGKKAGIGIAAFCVLMVTRVRSYDAFVSWLVPVHWVNLSTIAPRKISQAPTVIQAVAALGILILILSVFSVRRMRPGKR